MVNDEFTQIHRAMFNRISLGLVLIGGLLSVAILATAGVESNWFVFAIALVVLAAVVYVVGWVGRIKSASYLLAFGLITLSGVLFYQPNTVKSLFVVLLIPIVIITGLLLSPVGTLVLTGALILSLFAAVTLSGQLDMTSTAILLVTGGVLLLVALLLAAQKNNLLLLDRRLAQSRALLKERALELMQALNRIDWLDTRNRELERDLKQSRRSTSELQATVAAESGQMVDLIQGTADTLAESIDQLESALDAVSDLPALNGQQETIENAWRRLHTLRTLTVHLEELAQVENNTFSLAFEAVDLRQLIQEVASTGRGLTRGKDIEVRVEVVDNLPEIQADPVRLRQVLLHLVSNAINFTDHGVVEIRGELDGQQAMILVSDTGIGLSSDEASQVFDMFGRGKSSEAMKRQGAGLGLVVSKRLVELHGGRIWVNSVKNRGSTFYVALPIRKTARPVPAAMSAKAIKTALRFEKLATPTAAVATAAAATMTSPEVPVLREDAVPQEDTIISSVGQEIEVKDDATPVTPEVLPAARDDTIRTKHSELRRQAVAAGTRPLQPIHRFQPKYIRRFGYVLLGILGLILIVVAVLAVTNRPIPEEQSAGLSPDVDTNTASRFSASNGTPDLPVVGAEPSATGAAAVVVVSTPTELPSAPATAVPRPTDTTEPSPTSSPTNSATPVPPTQIPTSTATPQPPSPTASATATQPLATATPLPPTATAEPTASPSGEVVSPPAPSATTAPLSPQIAYSGGEGVPVAAGGRVSWSSSGQALYANDESSGRDIFVIASPGAVPVNLTSSTSDDVQPAWAPNGGRIAFSSGRTGSFKIFVMDADGQNLMQLTDGRGFDEWPAWSPNGDQLAFVSDRDGNVEIYTINADGSNLQRRTDHPADDWPVGWSADGQWLVFSSNRDGNWNLYLLSVAGGGPRQLTDSPGDERDPVWLSDGSIAFSHNGSGNWDIYTLWPNAVQVVPTSSWTQITKTLADERFPAQQVP